MRSDNGRFLGYSETSNAFIVYNSRTLTIEESIHVKFNKNKHDKDLSELDESFTDLKLDDGLIETSSSSQNLETKASTQQESHEEVKEPTGHIMRRNYPKSQIIEDLTNSVQTRS